MSSHPKHALVPQTLSARRRWTLRAQGAAVVLAGLVAAGGLVPLVADAGTTAPLVAPPSDTTADDDAAVELGAQFTVTVGTSATGVRFYKGIGNDGPHTGRLWNSSGQLLATTSFVDEDTTGWQRARFDTPVPLATGTTYTVSYTAPHGHYSATEDAFTDGNVLTSGPARLTSGVYAYGGDGRFPRSTWHDTNYYVSVTTPTSTTPPTTPPATTPPVDGGGNWPDSPPDAGTPEGADLDPVGGMTVTTPGTVLSNLLIRGTVTVAADDVVIENSRVEGSGDYGIEIRSGASARIVRTTVTGFDNGIAGDDYTADRVELTGLHDDGFKLGSRVVVVNSWCHAMTPSDGAHADCGQIQGGETDVVVRHNWFDPGEAGNAALFVAPDLGPSSPGPVTIADNVLGGGNYSLFCVDGDDGRYLIDDITIVGNNFLRDSRYGPVRVNVTVLWLLNTWADTGLPVLL